MFKQYTFRVLPVLKGVGKIVTDNVVTTESAQHHLSSVSYYIIIYTISIGTFISRTINVYLYKLIQIGAYVKHQ